MFLVEPEYLQTQQHQTYSKKKKMAIKLTIFVLGTLLLAQTTYAAPVDSSDENFLEELGNIFKQIAERFEIFKITLDAVHELDNLVKEKGKIVLKKVLEDPKVLEVKSDVMQKHLQEIREYVDKLEKDESATKSNLLEFLDFEDLVNKFEKEKVEDITHEAEVIGKSLKENGLEEFEKTVSEHFDKFVKVFIEKMDGFLDTFTNKEKDDEKSMVDWYNKFSSEKDFTKKINLFDDFFDFLSDDSKENNKKE